MGSAHDDRIVAETDVRQEAGKAVLVAEQTSSLVALVLDVRPLALAAA